MTRLQQLAAGALLLAAATGAAGVFDVSAASAASCSAVEIRAGQNLTFNVSSVYVTKGACVRFANLTDVTVTVTVSGSSFSTRLPARTPASASASYTANKSAGVTASDGVRTGHGSITVEKAESTPTPAQSQIVPTATAAPSGTAKPSKSSKPEHTDAPAESDVPTDAPAAVNTNTATGFGDIVPPVPPPPAPVSGGGSTEAPAVSHPVVAPRLRSTDPRLTSTVLEPASGPRRGLPATVAAVLLLGLAAAYGRTVLVAGEAVERHAVRRPLRPTV